MTDPDDLDDVPSADPSRDAAVRAALAATRAELAALPTPELPPEVAARWSAALAAEADRPGSARPGSARHMETCGRAGRRRGRVPRRLLVTAAAVAVVAGVGVGKLGVLTPRPVPVVTRVELVSLARSTVGTMDLGELTDGARRDACLRAAAPDAAGERLLGGRRVMFDGRPGVLLVLATGTRGGLRILTVDPGCGGPEGGSVRAEVVVD